MKEKTYFILNTIIIDEDIVGCWPQSEENEPPMYYEERKKLRSLKWEETLPESIPGLSSSMVLSKEAKLTDIITTNNYASLSGFPLSIKAKDLLKDFDIEQGKFYETSILQKRKKTPFSFLYLLMAYDLINYNDSDFISEHLISSDAASVKPLQINSLEEFDAQRDILIEDSLTIRPEKLVIKREADMFLLPLTPFIFVSEKLKKVLESNKITGLGYEKAFCDVFVPS